MNPTADEAERQARVRVQRAIQATVSLVTREVDAVDVAPAVLVEGVEVQLVAQLLAAMTATLLDATLPDGGRQLLIRIGLQAANDPEGER